MIYTLFSDSHVIQENGLKLIIHLFKPKGKLYEYQKLTLIEDTFTIFS